MSNVNEIGTLLWIGDNQGVEFKAAFQVAQQNAAQLAHREDLADALQRPATNVQQIVLVSNDRQTLDTATLQQIASRHPDADRIRLLGPLCEGMMRSESEFFGADKFDWQQGPASVSEMITQQDGVAGARPAKIPSLVVVIASSIAAATPLLEITELADVASVWCRQPCGNVVRGASHVWWDDSFATPTDEWGWRSRILESGFGQAEHAWICNRVHHSHLSHARTAGIEQVSIKPYSIEPLLRMLGASLAQVERAADKPRRVFAA